MKIQWTTSFAAACIVAVLAVSAPRSVSADDVSRDASESSDMMRKLGRGIVNLLTGVVEIPKNIAREWKDPDSDPISGSIIGFVKGVGWAWARTCAGAYEIVTFSLPVPEGYVPLMEPEFILTDIWGEAIPEVNEFPDWT